MNKTSSEIIQEPFYVAKPIRVQLLKSKKVVMETDQDRVYVITGREGKGKSTLAMQLAYTVDPTFNLSQIVFNSSQFERKIRELPKHKALVFDEAFNGLSSKGSLSKENKKLVRILTECRQRNLFIFIVLPSIFLLEKYVAVFRSHALFNVGISKNNYKNRFYKVYNYQNKKVLYLIGKPMMNYSKPKIAMSHRFYGKIPPTIDDAEYRAKKLDAFKDNEHEEYKESAQVQQRDYLFYKLHTEYNVSASDISRDFDKYSIPLSNSIISRAIKAQSKKLTSDADIVYNNKSGKKT